MRGKWTTAAALLALGLVVGLRGLAGGGAGEAKAKLPPDLAQVPPKGLLLLSFRPAELWDSALVKGARAKMGKQADELVKAVEEGVGLSPDKIERFTVVVPDARGADTVLIFVSARDKVDYARLRKQLVPKGTESKYSGCTLWADDRNALAALDERIYVYGTKGDVQTTLDTKPGATTGLAEVAKRAAGKHTVVIGINPAALPPLPEELPPDAEPFKPLLKARLATVTIDVGAKTEGEIRVEFEDADTAAAGLKAMEAGRKALRGVLAGGIKQMSKDETAKAVVGLMKDLDESLQSGTLRRDGRAVLGTTQMKLDIARAGGLGLEVVARVRGAAGRTQSANNLKQIGLAFHNYHDVNGAFPPHAVYDKDGKPLLSWRVLLLPFLEADELYKQFKLDEAWDSPHNKKLLAKMPRVFQLPGDKKPAPGVTHYLSFLGKGAIFEGKRGIRLTDITDGTSNTILVAEAAKGVPWSKPDDMPFDPDGALPKLGGVVPGGHNTLFCDGSVRFLRAMIDPKVLRALITRNGGEVIPGDF